MNLTRWDWFLFAGAAFLAVRALIRMLIARRDEMRAAIEGERFRAAKAKQRREEQEAAAALAESTAADKFDDAGSQSRAA